VNPIDI